MNAKAKNIPKLIVLLALIIGISSCEMPNKAKNLSPSPTPPPSAPKLATAPQPLSTSESESGNLEPQAQPAPPLEPDPTAEFQGPVATSAIRTWFEESDCSLSDMTGLEAGYGPGVLDCSYNWSGKYIDDNTAQIEIYEIPDGKELARQFEEGLNNSHSSADSKSSNEMQSLIQNDANGFIFVDTYPGGGSSKTNTEIPQCARGSGYFKVNERFLVHLRLFSCDISDAAINYVRTMENMQDLALKAITRAQSAANP
jgi:hypothetical protein